MATKGALSAQSAEGECEREEVQHADAKGKQALIGGTQEVVSCPSSRPLDVTVLIQEQIDTDSCNPSEGTEIHITLLGLPAELRISIYEYALLDANTITVTPSLQQPALLNTCRQIRKEAITVWYQSNVFFAVINDCDSTMLSAFHKHCKRVTVSVPGVKLRVMGEAKWADLKLWCKRAFEGNAWLIDPEPRINEYETVVAAAHATTRQFSDLAEHDNREMMWRECEKTLEILRAAVGKFQPGWLV